MVDLNKRFVPVIVNGSFILVSLAVNYAACKYIYSNLCSPDHPAIVKTIAQKAIPVSYHTTITFSLLTLISVFCFGSGYAFNYFNQKNC